MKRLLGFLTLLLLLASSMTFPSITAGPPPPAPPGAPFRYIHIRLLDGTVINAGVTSRLEISTAGKLHVGTGNAEWVFPLEKVQGWNLVLSDSIIVSTPIVMEEEDISFSILPGKIIIRNCKSDTKITLYDLQGIIRPVPSKKESTEVELDLSTLPHGIYILNTGNKSLKFQSQ